MRQSEYEEMEKLEQFYWWHIGRNYLIRTACQKYKIKGAILNIGCGTGGTIPTLEQFGQITNIDHSVFVVKMMKRKGYQAVLSDATDLPFSDGMFDTVVALDVLEHIANDKQAIIEWRRVLKKHGQLVLAVPAYQWLWSGHDHQLGHCRRYHLNQLINITKSNDFQLVGSTYAVSFVFPIIALWRYLGKLNPLHKQKTSYIALPGFINNWLISLLKLESIIIKKINLPFGTSIIAVFRKK